MRLYKYVAPQRVDILENACIRFTQPSVFNDPFEMSPIITGAADVEHFESDSEVMAEARNQFDRLPDEDRQRITFEQFFEEFVNQLNLELENSGAIEEAKNVLLPRFYAETGVLSLTEKPDNLLMWSHYTDNHRGFVIEFAADHPFFDQRMDSGDQFHHVRKVQYSTERPVTTIGGFLGPHSLLTKSVHWEYEQEWRMLIYLPKFTHETVTVGDEEIHLVSIPPTCISGIILGSRMPEERKAEIVEVLTRDNRFSHVEMMQAELHPRKFALNFRGLPEHYYQRGKALFQRGIRWRDDEDDFQLREKGLELLNSALPDLDRAVQLAPNEPIYLATRAILHQILDRQNEALADYSRVIELDPSNAEYYAARGQIYAEQGEFDRAESDFERASNLGFEDADLYLDAVQEIKDDRELNAPGPLIQCDVCGNSSTEDTQYWQCEDCGTLFCAVHGRVEGVAKGSGFWGKLKGLLLGRCPTCYSENTGIVYTPAE